MSLIRRINRSNAMNFKKVKIIDIQDAAKEFAIIFVKTFCFLLGIVGAITAIILLCMLIKMFIGNIAVIFFCMFLISAILAAIGVAINRKW